MASSSSILLSRISSTAIIENRDLCSNFGACFLRTKPRRSAAPRKCGFKFPVAQKSYDHIPKQFRQENLKDGCEEHLSFPLFKDFSVLLLLGFWEFSCMFTQDEKNETVGTETEAYAIADTMAYCKTDVYTINCGKAFGQAAMLLSVGEKGHRAVQPSSSTKLYLPKVSKSSGTVIDMWLKARELDANSDSYLDLLSKGTGKSKEEIEKDIQRPKYFRAQEAIDYGLADKIIDTEDAAFEKRNYEELLAQSKAMRSAAAGRIGPQASPSGFR